MSAASERRIGDVVVGEQLPEAVYPINTYRLVMEAGANRDFNSIHHNSAYARSTGAPDMYANTLFLMGMWERAVRDWAGPSARIVAIRKFRMGRFNTVGHTTRVQAQVTALDPASGRVTLTVACLDDAGLTVGPGEVDVVFPIDEPAEEQP